MTEREAAVEWLENLTPEERQERFIQNTVTALCGYDGEDRISSLATIKNDHVGAVAYCRWCADPGLVVVG